MYFNLDSASLTGVTIGIMSSSIELETRAIAAGIKKYKSITKKKKKHGKIGYSAKPKLNQIQFLISKDLISSNISHDKFVLVNNVRKGYIDMKEEIKNLMS